MSTGFPRQLSQAGWSSTDLSTCRHVTKSRGRAGRDQRLSLGLRWTEHLRVSLVYRTGTFLWIGASCSTHVSKSVITTNRIHCANPLLPCLINPWFDPSHNPAAFVPRYRVALYQ